MRTIKASALTDKHFGEVVSCDPQPEPRRLTALLTGVTFVGLFLDGTTSMTPLEPDDDVTIHEVADG